MGPAHSPVRERVIPRGMMEKHNPVYMHAHTVLYSSLSRAVRTHACTHTHTRIHTVVPASKGRQEVA